MPQTHRRLKTSCIGLLIHKRLKNDNVEYDNASDRVTSLVIHVSKRYTMQITQVYAQTISYTDGKVEDF